MLTAGSSLSGAPADELIEKSALVMREYRETIVVMAETARVAALEAHGEAAARGGSGMVPAPTHGGIVRAGLEDKVDAFTTLW